MRRTATDVVSARQGRFFVTSRPRVARAQTPGMMQLQREFAEPWQRAHSGRRFVIDNLRRTVGQWRTVVSREPDPDVRTALVRRYLALTDSYVVRAQHPVGLMLVRWVELHAQAVQDVAAAAIRQARMQTSHEVIPATGTIGNAATVERFRRRTGGTA